MAGEQEPGGWELLRAIKGIETRLDSFTSGYVPLAVYATLVETVRELKQDLDTERTARERDTSAIRKELDEARKTKAQMWTAIALLVVGGIVTVVIGVINKGLGVS